MNVITTLTNYPNQRHQLILENRESADFHLYYKPRVQSWFYDIEYNETTINGVKVVLTPNSLRQFRKNIPLGLTFYADSVVEPFALDDFSSGRVKMGILSSQEVEQVEREVYNK